MVVEEVMSRSPITVKVTDSVGTALSQLLQADVRHLPVLEGKSLSGMLSDRDLREVAPRGVLSQQEVLDRDIATIMSSDIVTVNPETDLTEAIDLMIEHKIGAVPVVEVDSLQLVGIVSYVDVLRRAREYFE